MRAKLISDEVWDEIKQLLPPAPPKPAGGRPPIGDREVLTGVLFVLRTGIPWEELPGEMGCGCGVTCLRRLRQWQTAGVWQQVRSVLLAHLRNPMRYNWSRAECRPTRNDPLIDEPLPRIPASVHERPTRGRPQQFSGSLRPEPNTSSFESA